MNTVFVHVSDLQRSVTWYTKLLCQDVNLSEVSNPVYNVKVNHHTGLVLDAGPIGMKKEITASDFPLFNFHTDDMEGSYEFVKRLGYSIESEIVRFDDFSYFTIRDPDEHIVMICTG